jgi:hypothetical protein
MKTKEVYVCNNKHPIVYIENIVSISSKIDWDEKCLMVAKHFSLNKHYNLPYHYVPANFSMFQAIDIKHIVYHF